MLMPTALRAERQGRIVVALCAPALSLRITTRVFALGSNFGNFRLGQSCGAPKPLIIGLAKTEADHVVAEPIEYPK
jgi:hypothetical protein